MSDVRGLTPKEEAFCIRIVAGDNGTTAARNAGYSPKGADAAAARLRRKPDINVRIEALREVARRGVTVPDAGQLSAEAAAVVLSREYLLRRLVEMQHGQRDSVAFNAVVKLGQEEFDMFAEKIVTTDPSLKSTEQLQKEREALRKKFGLSRASA